MDVSPEQISAERARFRRLIHKAYGYETHEAAVDLFHASEAKTKIVSCPARTSKSYAAVYDVLPDVFYHGGKAGRLNEDGSMMYPELETMRIWIVAPNYELAKEFDYFWEALIERRETMVWDYEVKKAAKSPGQGNMIIHLGWGKNAKGQDIDVIISVRSAANEKTLQSEEVDIAILSEAARLDSIVWTKYLSTRVGRSIWPTTPDIQAVWIHKEIEDSKNNPGAKTEHFQFTPKANPKYKYDRYWVEHQKAERRVDANCALLVPPAEFEAPSADNGHDCFDPMTECTAMKDASFAEQFGGQWTFHRGRVVPFREEVSATGEPAHVIHEDREWFKWCDIHVAMDYGYTDPGVVGFWLIGPNQVVLRQSIYKRGMTPDEVVDRTRAIIKKNGWENRVTRYVGDPKKPEVCETFRRRGMPIYDQDKNAQADRKAGHLELMNFLATNPVTGEPNMLIHSDNVDVLEEWGTLRYNDRVRDPNSQSAFIGRDDAYDMARYFVQSHPPVEKGEKLIRLANTDFAKMRKSIMNQRPKRVVTVGRPHASGLAAAGL